jgi:Bacterial PH domain
MRPDIAAAWARVRSTTGTKRDVRRLPEYLNGSETVLAMTSGKVGTNLGLLVATDRRVLFVSEGVINRTFEDFPYDRINTVMSSRQHGVRQVF